MLARTMFAVATLAAAAHATAQCTRIDFENLANGVAVGGQYDGVTFSTFPGSVMRINNNIAGGTSSGTRCIRIDPDSGGASLDAFRMVFDSPQSVVTFALGADNGTYTIRRYSTANGALGEILPAMNVVVGIPGPVFPGVKRFVQVNAPAGDLRRIEIVGFNSIFEGIDDLSFNADGTPPIAEISAPGWEACGCGVVTVRGRACEPDGEYGSDILHYQRVDAAPGAAWTEVDSFTTPQCAANGVLYSWNTAPAAITEGLYYLRLTVVNACGLTSTDQVVVYVDKSFSMNEVSIRSPVNGAVVGGTVCLDGTVQDHCFDNYTVKYRPAAAGVFMPVEPLVASYPVPVINDPLAASWNTKVGGAAVVDGDYLLRIQGTDDCGNTAIVTRSVTVDNTIPAAIITSPTNCAYRCGMIQVTGTASDLHLDEWILDYTGGGLHTWSDPPIAQGIGNVNGGVLANWNTAGLAPCDYTLRLRVWDSASVDCGSGTHFNEYLVNLHIGAYADCNGDGVLTVADFGCYQTRYVLGCP